MSAPQNFKNHARFDPPWHFFLVPVFLLNIIFAIFATIRHWPDHPHLFPWWVVMSIAMFVALGVARGHAMKVQDRIIRLEEKLRYERLLSGELRIRAEALTLRQIIALRFASDAELPALIERALNENLDPKQIKQSIVDWRGDYLRV
jgi:Family of unknown function (DUF6526)